MKLRLEVTAAAGKFSSFAHEGPLVRIGRSPQGELVIEGSASEAVSWEHAEIKLTAFGALVNDLHSTNGTFVNDKRVSDQVLVKVGDLIQFGNTGPVVRVLELDLTPAREREPRPRPEVVTPVKLQPVANEPRPLAKPASRSDAAESIARTDVAPAAVPTAVQRQQRLMLIGMSVAVVCIVAVLAVFWNKLQRLGAPAPADLTRTNAPEPGPGQSLEPRRSAEPIEDAVPHAPPREGGAMPGKFAVMPVNPGVVPGKVGAAAASDVGAPPAADKEHQAIGMFESWAKAPNILLQRESELFPWARVRPRERLQTESSLLCLPGYRSSLLLDSGVRMVLWGNVPEFGAFPPLLESVVTLHPPGPDSDADFTLDRGRVVLAMNKPAGQARIRIRFRQETWEVILADPKTEVAVELWGLYPGDIPFGKDPVACLGLFVKGRAHLRARQREIDLPNSSQTTWANTTGKLVGPETLPALPRWWTNQLAAQPAAAEEQAVTGHMIIALNDLAKEIDKQDAVIDTVITLTREASYVQLRALGVFSLGALENISRVVDALDDRQFPDVRFAAAFVLRTWLSRNPDYAAELRRILSAEKGYSKPKVEAMLSLLHDFSAGEIDDAKTYAKLIEYLNHDNLPIRDLASWHLYQMVPGAKESIPYDPAAGAEDRQRVVEQWKKLLTDGKLPPRKG